MVKLGVLKSASDAGFYVALGQGYFMEQGIDVKTTQFTTAANMVAPLAANQLDAGGGAPSAGLNNAIGRGIGIKIVADKGSVLTKTSFEALIIRKALVDSGRFKNSYKDLKGMKIAVAGKATSPVVAIDSALRLGGLHIKDVNLTYMGFPDMLTALSGGSIDAAQSIEPFATEIPAKGVGVVFKRSNVYHPNDQIAVVLYGPGFMKNRSDVAKRFMTAYLKGVRLYSDAFVKKDQTAYNQVVDVLVKATTVKDKTLYAKMQMPGLNPDGQLIMKSLTDDQSWYIAHGDQQKAIDMNSAVDSSFAQSAVQQLGGPYK